MKSSDKSIIQKYNPSEIESKWPRKELASSRRPPASRSRGASLRGKQEYNPGLIESKWQGIWESEKIYSPDLDKPFDSAQGLRPFYNLMMFPYLSAEGMHVGNMYAFTGADVYGRFKRMQGVSVFEPIGLDGFGIHSENYAIKVGKHPVKQAKISEKNYYKQLRSIGNGFDWTRTVETYKPEYYKWTQWLFIQLFKAGLAYRKKAPVNFCPSCKTVLSDEQVIDSLCERCNSTVEKRDLEQWFFKITQYADRLLSNLSQIDWAEKVKIAQREWIGRSEGARIEFKIQNSKFKIEVFTTRADTLYGATFLVLSSEHPVVDLILKGEFEAVGSPPTKLKSYVEEAKKKTERERGMGREKTGVFSGLYAVNPVNQEKIPVWIADYAIMGYGTGALFGDAHDERDVAFAKKYGIPLKPTLKTENSEKDKRIQGLEECFTGEGILFDSGEFSGLTSKEARKKIAQWLSRNASGGPKTTYHLRDWLISRQRYWGPPIPLVFCENCAQEIKNQKSKVKNEEEFNRGEIDNPGWIAIDEKELPVELPFIKDYKPLGIHSAGSGQAVQAPLASHPEFYKTKCPKCAGPAKRETDVSDTFLDSAWYFLRYVSTDMKTTAFDAERVKKWLPVNMYIGGAEHSVLHLLYSRFITMALHDLGFISFEEPFTKFRAHGLIVKDGAKMSKSKGNVVIPDAYIKKFGADSLRTYLMFMGPFSQGGDFRDSGIEGMSRFLRRVWTLTQKSISNSKFLISNECKRMMHKTIKKVTEDIEGLSYNTAIAALMEWYNFLSDEKEVSREEIRTLLLLLAPFAPHVSEELFQLLNGKKEFSSIHNSFWPTYDDKFLVKDELAIIVQVNGKLRGNLVVDRKTSKNRSKIEELARRDSKAQGHIEGKNIIKIIQVEGKVINFVTNV